MTAEASTIKSDSAAALAAQPTVSRIAGADRYLVANAVSRSGYPNGSSTVYVATGSNFPDALSAAPAAIVQSAPLLLTPTESLPESVRVEIARLKPGKIVVVGGPASISAAVETSLKRLAPVTRIGGADRYAVSRAVAKYAFGATGATTAYVASGNKYPDALSSGSAAGVKRAPVILVDGGASSVDNATKRLIGSLNVSTIKVVGGTGTVSPGVVSSLANTFDSVTRIAGEDRLETSRLINRDGFAASKTAYLATGYNFADALTGSPLAGKMGAPLFLVAPSCVPASVLAEFTRLGVTSVTLIGGTRSLDSSVAALESCDAPTPDPTPTPDPDPTLTPDPTPTPGIWPTGATTGVPAGTTLTNASGRTVTVAGTVLENLNITGDVIINANNVTIRNSKVNGRIWIRPPYAGLVVQRVEIAGPGGEDASKTEAIGYANFTCDGCNIHGWGKGAMLDANVTIKNSWIHDMATWGDPATGSHNETILSLGGPNYTIVNNRLDSGGEDNFTASLAFLNQWDSFTNTLVQGNLFNGGGYCVYAGGEAAHNSEFPSSNVRFLDNTFGTDAYAKCGYYGAAVAWDAGGAGNQWSGNKMIGGTTVPTPSS